MNTFGSVYDSEKIYIYNQPVCLLVHVLPRLPAQSGGSPGDGRYSGNPEAAEDGPARPADAVGSVQRSEEEHQTAATGTWSLPSVAAGRVLALFTISLTFCVAWLVALDQIVPLPETQRTKSPASAAPPPGPDTRVHAAPAVGQLSGCRGAGTLHAPAMFSCYPLASVPGGRAANFLSSCAGAGSLAGERRFCLS